MASTQPRFTRTRWWWIRHAPVRVDNGCIYGQSDLPCDTSETHVYEALHATLPHDAVWVASHLCRTHQTAEAIWRARGATYALDQYRELAEQHLGEWQGRNRVEFFASRGLTPQSFWFAPAEEVPPGGESFVAVYDRVKAAMDRINATHQGKDIVAVAHGGPIRAALGVALGISAQDSLAFTIDNCSVTRMDYLEGDNRKGWKIDWVNFQPWLNGRSGEGSKLG